MGEINTKITGNPDSMRDAAAWLRNSLGREVSEAAQAITTARNTADAAWDGVAGDAFSAKMLTAARQGFELATLINTSAAKFDDLAGQLQNAQAHMHEVRTNAAKAGLQVVGDVIKESTDTAKAGAYAAAEKYSAAGHMMARQYCNAAKAALEDIKSKWGFVIGDLMAANPEKVGAARAAQLTKRAQGLTDAARDMDVERARLAPGTQYLHSQDLRYGARDLNRSAAATRATASKWASAGKWAGRIGYVGAGASVGYDIFVEKKDPAKSVTTATVGIGTGMAVGAIIGSAVPGPGTLVGAGVGATFGLGVSMMTSGWVDSMWDDDDHRVSNAVGEGLKYTGSKIGSVSKTAWRALF